MTHHTNIPGCSGASVSGSGPGRVARPGIGAYARFVATTAQRLGEVRAKAESALACVRADGGASPVVVAVVREFAKKAEKVTRTEDEWTAVVELEHAGDSAKAAAEADGGLADASRDAVLDAPLAICVVKAKVS